MRKLLARTSSLMTRGAVYEVEDGLEAETTDNYEIARQRVLYRDIALVTLHRRVGWVFVLINLGIVAFFLTMAGFFATLLNGAEMWAFAGVFGAFGSPFLIAALLRLAFRVDEVTVWGLRSQASIRYTFRKSKARDLYDEITEKVRTAQERLRAQYEAEAAPVPEPLPPSEAPPMPPPAMPPQ